MGKCGKQTLMNESGMFLCDSQQISISPSANFVYGRAVNETPPTRTPTAPCSLFSSVSGVQNRMLPILSGQPLMETTAMKESTGGNETPMNQSRMLLRDPSPCSDIGSQVPSNAFFALLHTSSNSGTPNHPRRPLIMKDNHGFQNSIPSLNIVGVSPSARAAVCDGPTKEAPPT